MWSCWGCSIGQQRASTRPRPLQAHAVCPCHRSRAHPQPATHGHGQPPSSGEIESPERTLPRALALAIVSVVVCTGLPLLVAAGNDRFWRCWEEGSINAVMAQLCGPWLGIWAVISSAVCCTEPNPWTRSRQRTALFRHAPWMHRWATMGCSPRSFWRTRTSSRAWRVWAWHRGSSRREASASGRR
jgi:hypothetical protein